MKNNRLRMNQDSDRLLTTNWTKIDEQQVEGSWMGYEDFISDDGKLCKRVWYDGEEEIFKISE